MRYQLKDISMFVLLLLFFLNFNLCLLLCIKSTYQVSASKLGAIVIGSIGIILVSASDIGLAAKNPKSCLPNGTTVPMNISDNTTVSPSVNEENTSKCTPFSAAELAGSLLALLGGSVMWSMSSSKYFFLKVFLIYFSVGFRYITKKKLSDILLESLVLVFADFWEYKHSSFF